MKTGNKRSLGSTWMLLAAGLLIGLGLGLLLLAAWGISSPILAVLRSMAGSRSPTAQLNSPAPDFALQDLEGSTLRLSDQRGKVVLINFWATWCGPCRAEMPVFEEYAALHPDEFVVLGINVDESPAVVRAFADELGLTFPILLDPGGEARTPYRVRGLPASFLVDQEGMIRYQHLGTMSASQLQKYLATLGVIE
jgi:cytochrome c biogenesis protein CcmG, thiol:disulfide interchange protein DsbE